MIRKIMIAALCLAGTALGQGTGGGGVPGGGGGAAAGSTVVAPSGDSTGATDGVNIGNACTSTSSVQLIAGNYYVGAGNTAITLSAPCKIKGAGFATVITNKGTTNDVFRISYYTTWAEGPWVYPASTNQTELSNFQIAQSGTPTAGYAFDIGSGIAASGGTYSYTMNVHIYDTVINGTWGGAKLQSDELYVSIDHDMWRQFVGGGCIYYNAAIGSGDNHFGPGLECSGLTNSGIIIGQSDIQSFVGVKLNGSGITFLGTAAAGSVVFDDVSIETGISQPCAIDFGTATAPTNIQINNSESLGFTTLLCHPTNVSGLAFTIANLTSTTDYPTGLISNGGYTPVSIAYQDFATFAGTIGTAISSYTTTAGKTFAQYTGDGVSPLVVPVLTGTSGEKISGGGNSFGDSLDSLTPATANYSVAETFTLAATTDQVGVFGRALSASNTNYVCLWGGSGNLVLYSQVPGTSTALLTVGYTWAAGATHTLKLTMNGTSIGCQVDGVSITGSPVTNSAVSATGQAGSRVYAGATGTNFYVQ